MREIKRDIRRRRRTAAWIFVEGETKSHECQVVDISDNGAKLLLDPVTDLPASFMLTRVPKSKVREACDVVWQRGRTVGIKFVR